MKLRFALVAALGFVTASCSNNPYEVVVSSCPAISVVGDIGTLTRFVGDGRDTTDVALTASVTDARITCVEGDSGVVSQITFDLIATAGPALSGSNASVSYFVAVMKDNSVIVTKKIYDVSLRFGGSANSFSARQTIQNIIPSLSQAQHYNYEILVGLQLTPDEAAYNIAR